MPPSGSLSRCYVASPLSEGVVRGIERARLILRKDLPDAIATAFQIAEAQRSAA